MFQSISAEVAATNFPKPYLLSVYGVNNKFTALDILRRWIYIFENCLDEGIRVIGFYTGKSYAVFVAAKCFSIVNRYG